MGFKETLMNLADKVGDTVDKGINKGKESYNKMAEKARGAYKSTLKELEDEADPITAKKVAGEAVTSVNKGDIVVIADIGRDATVIDVKIDKKQAYVMAGAIKMWVGFDNLRFKSSFSPTTERPKTRNVTGIKSRAERQAVTEIDLRGQASDEAILELDSFIDNAILSGIDTIRIIHGKGTGVLRKNVQAHLRHHKNIKSFRLGTFGEGENGVTIAELEQ